MKLQEIVKKELKEMEFVMERYAEKYPLHDVKQMQMIGRNPYALLVFYEEKEAPKPKKKVVKRKPRR